MFLAKDIINLKYNILLIVVVGILLRTFII